jgi:hypothetical protein
MKPLPFPLRPFGRLLATVGVIVVGLGAAAVHAHHAGHALSVPSARCGWVDGSDLRARRLATEFCGRWIDGELGIAGASAMGERLFIEAPPTLRSALREDDRHTAALLTNWLEHWRQTSGYRSATVILVSRHVEFARIQSTMKGDVVVIR